MAFDIKIVWKSGWQKHKNIWKSDDQKNILKSELRIKSLACLVQETK